MKYRKKRGFDREFEAVQLKMEEKEWDKREQCCLTCSCLNTSCDAENLFYNHDELVSLLDVCNCSVEIIRNVEDRSVEISIPNLNTRCLLRDGDWLIQNSDVDMLLPGEYF